MLSYCSLKSKRRNARWIWQVSSLCALAGAACSDQPGVAPSRVPAEPTAASAPAVTTTTAELRTLPYPLVDENEKEDVEVRIKFIAYGDIDPNDDIDFGMIPNMKVFMIKGGRELADWWDAVWDVEMGISSIAPGVQIQSSAKDIESSPVDFVTTRSDGTVETYVEPYSGYTICVVSPTINVIAGCNRHEWVGEPSDYMYYIYFSHGRAYIEKKSDGSERYYRFLYGHRDSYGPSEKPATVTFVSTGYTGSDIEPYVYFLTPSNIAVIDDDDIGTWWEAVSDDGTSIKDGRFFSLSIYIYGEDPAYGIPYDNAAHQRVLDNIPIRTISVGWSGILETKFEPGNYLFCNFNNEEVLGCDYEDIAAAQEYIFRVEFGIWPLSDSEGKQFLEEVKNWAVKPWP